MSRSGDIMSHSCVIHCYVTTVTSRYEKEIINGNNKSHFPENKNLQIITLRYDCHTCNKKEG